MKVKVSEAVPGKWYENHIGVRCLCVGPGRLYCSNLGIFTMSPHELLTHLPDCTGWDWRPPKPEKRYRAFASAEEFKPHRDRWILTPGQGTIRRIDFYNDQWVNGMSYESLLRNRTFEDGMPCGVEVSE
jgi:hypothetical protein